MRHIVYFTFEHMANYNILYIYYIQRYLRSLKTPLIPEENQKYHRQLAIITSNYGIDEDELILNLQSLFVC